MRPISFSQINRINSWFCYQGYTFELSLDTKIFIKLHSNHAIVHSLSLDCFCIYEKCQIYITMYHNIPFILINIVKEKIRKQFCYSCFMENAKYSSLYLRILEEELN